jgi:hypothetical protein
MQLHHLLVVSELLLLLPAGPLQCLAWRQVQLLQARLQYLLVIVHLPVSAPSQLRLVVAAAAVVPAAVAVAVELPNWGRH